MPKFMGVDADEAGKTLHGFDYTSIAVDKLGATEYTVVTIVVDKTTSVRDFKDGLEKMIGACVGSCRRSPRALNLLVRVTTFNSNGIEELHGFTLLGSIEPDDYVGTIHPGGITNLFAATLEAVEITNEYVQKLFDDERICNANSIIYVITDGDDNASEDITEDTVKEALQNVGRSEVMESMDVILIGVNDEDAYYQRTLGDFKDKAGLNEYMSMGDVTEEKLAKLGKFMSESISSKSVNLGTGNPSTYINTFKF